MRRLVYISGVAFSLGLVLAGCTENQSAPEKTEEVATESTPDNGPREDASEVDVAIKSTKEMTAAQKEEATATDGSAETTDKVARMLNVDWDGTRLTLSERILRRMIGAGLVEVTGCYGIDLDICP